MENKERKIFSLNLVAYLMANNVRPIKMGLEGKKAYYIFPECGNKILEYKKDYNLQKFLNCYKEIRREIAELIKKEIG
ncbi:MAG: DUF5659 domain-containing protein [bacterium]